MLLLLLLLLSLLPMLVFVVVLIIGVLMCLEFKWWLAGDFNSIADDDEVEIGLIDYFDCKRRDGDEE